MKRPIVSVVIPCYNQAHFLKECLQSVAAQTMREWEAIVVDDASTQGNILRLVSAFEDPRIRVLRHNRNRGLGASRNTGFREAQAQLVLPVDSDDALEPDFLESAVALCQDRREVDCAFTYFQFFGGSTEVCRFTVKTPRDMLEGQWIPGPGTLMRKGVWEALGGYDELLPPFCGNEDWDFWIGAMRRGIQAAIFPKPLYRYRRYPESMSATTLQYYDYVTRERIYRRHQTFFDRYSLGAAFRADGYLNSSVASSKRGESLRASYLAMRALLLQPRKRTIRDQAVNVAPRLLRSVLGRLARLCPPAAG